MGKVGIVHGGEATEKTRRVKRYIYMSVDMAWNWDSKGEPYSITTKQTSTPLM
jgi:hypothetical protein